jgi:hypothetical protein
MLQAESGIGYLEIHFVDRARQIGGFYEERLTIG